MRPTKNSERLAREQGRNVTSFALPTPTAAHSNSVNVVPDVQSNEVCVAPEQLHEPVIDHPVEVTVDAVGPRTSSRDASFSQCRVIDEANHLSLSMFDELMMRFDSMTRELKGEISSIREQVRANGGRLDDMQFGNLTPRSAPEVASDPAVASTSVPFRRPFVPHAPRSTAPMMVMPHSGITLFKSEISASHPLQRSQELEAWMKQIENVTQPSTGEAMCQMARMMCRGTAEVIINSSFFDGITDWMIFKGKLREKFRGVCSPNDYFTLLYQHRMLPGQTPFDFYLNLQAAVLQGERDYPTAIGDPDLLARRVFLQGIPQWMREALATRDDAPTDKLVQCAQQLWNTRVGVSHPQPTGHRRQAATVDFDPQVAALCEDRPAAMQSPTRGSRQHEGEGDFCSFHRMTGHSLADCRARAREERRCFRCGRSGHFASSCPDDRPYRPFQQRQGRSGGSSSTGIAADTRAYSPTSTRRVAPRTFTNTGTQVDGKN